MATNDKIMVVIAIIRYTLDVPIESDFVPG